MSHLDRFRERLVRLRYKHRAQMFTMATEQTRAKVAEQPIENLLVEGAKRLRMLFASLATVEHHLSVNKRNLEHNLRKLKVNHQAIERLEDEVFACRQACRDDSVQTVANFVDLRRLSPVQRQSLTDRLEAIQERWAVSQSLLSSYEQVVATHRDDLVLQQLKDYATGQDCYAAIEALLDEQTLQTSDGERLPQAATERLTHQLLQVWFSHQAKVRAKQDEIDRLQQRNEQLIKKNEKLMQQTQALQEMLKSVPEVASLVESLFQQVEAAPMELDSAVVQPQHRISVPTC